MGRVTVVNLAETGSNTSTPVELLIAIATCPFGPTARASTASIPARFGGSNPCAKTLMPGSGIAHRSDLPVLESRATRVVFMPNQTVPDALTAIPESDCSFWNLDPVRTGHEVIVPFPSTWNSVTWAALLSQNHTPAPPRSPAISVIASKPAGR